MIQVETLFENWFDDPRITVPRFKNFAQNNVTRMQANNTGNVYDTNITDTQLKITNLDNAIMNKGGENWEQASSVLGKNLKRELLQDFLSQKEGLIKSTFGKKSEEYKEFFPKGLDDFRRSTDEEFEEKTGIFLQKIIKYVGVLGAPFKADFETKRNAYVDAEAAVEANKGDVDGTGLAERVALNDLQIQLMINVYTIGIQNVGGPADVIATTFFDESLLFNDHTTHIAKGEVPAHAAKPAMAIEYHATNRFHIEHKSARPLKWQMHLNGVPVGNEFTTQIGEKLNKTYAEFAPDGDSLVVRNDEDETGKYRVIQTS
jgi:hypothetical protein